MKKGKNKVSTEHDEIIGKKERKKETTKSTKKQKRNRNFY